MDIEYKQLGTTGLAVSSIGLGCVTFGREIEEDISFAVLDRAVDRGITLLDTAAVYGDGASEEILGRWIRRKRARDRIVLATKVSGRLTRDRILASVEASLGRLATDRIDLLQAHSWDDQTPLDETLEALECVARQGKARACGCSNWGVPNLRQALSTAADSGWAPLQSVQPIYNLVDRRIEQELLGFCLERRIGVLTYSPLGAGFLTGKYRRGAPVPVGTRFAVIPGHQDIYFTDEGFHTIEALESAACDAGLSMAHLALSWVLRRDGITSVLIGARTPRHVDQAFDAMETAGSPELQNLLDRL